MSERRRKRRRTRDAAPAPASTAGAQAPEPRAGKGRRGSPLGQVGLFLGLVVLTLVLYAGDLSLGYFHVDDPGYVVNNPWIREASARNIAHILTEPYVANYSPLHLLSYLLDRELGGHEARVYHLSSNLWAGVVAGFVALLALALSGEWSVAVAAGALFVVHPAHVEAVAWISSRKDLVAAAFALPAILAYLRYRRGRVGARAWYAASLALFALAMAGKTSAAIVPPVLVLLDLLVERRRGAGVLSDKLLYLAVVAFFVLRVAGAQPETRHALDLRIVSHSVLQSLWLLLGFGDYVMYRPRPDLVASPALGVASVLLLALLGTGPLLLHRRLPGLAVTLWLATLLALLPPQALSFVHPVADRYLFLPSCFFVVLLALLLHAAGRRLGRRGRAAAAVGLAAVGALWARGALAYLGEWRDPRSVWFAASRKSEDAMVHVYLGGAWQDAAEAIDARPGSGGPPYPESAIALASTVWRDDPRLEELRAEWSRGDKGPRTFEYRDRLRDLAWSSLEEGLRRKGTQVAPVLYFRRAKLAFSRGQLDEAKAEFLRAYEESQRHTDPRQREEYAVHCHYSLGVVLWNQGRLEEALPYLRQAEEEQARSGGSWIAGIAETRARLERILAAR